MITIYTELGCLFDERRGIITKVAHESGNANFDWDRNFKEIYARRKMDYFHQPELGITQEAYLERFERRSIDDFADEKMAYYIPSNLIKAIFIIVRELEFGVGKMLSVSRFQVTVNLFPYALSDTLLEELKSTLLGAVAFPFEVSFVNIPYEEQTAKVLHSYNYVFKYDYFLNEKLSNYWSNYANASNTNTKIIVPDVIKDCEALPEEMRGEELINLISKLNAAQGGKVTWVPMTKSIFDYKE